MFALTESQMELIRRIFREILEDPSNESFAQAWLVWAELQIQTVKHPNKVEVVVRMMPLVMAAVTFSGADFEKVQKVLNQSVLRMLFQAKLEGRESLEMEDARKAILYVKDACLN